jgi:tRNA threonylcarbamoyl adenosine modification protein YeaZ
MRVLVLDSAFDRAAVAVFDAAADAPLAARESAMSRGQGDALVPMIREALADAGLALDGIDRIAVTVGPGSFTGVRIGISAAVGLSLATGLPVVGVGTIEAYAAHPAARDDHGAPSELAVAIDARHEAVYLRRLPLHGGRTDPAPVVVGLKEAVRLLDHGAWRIAGDAAGRLAELCGAYGVMATAVGPAMPDLATVGRLAAASDPAAHPPSPVYAKPPATSVGRQPAIARA